MGARTAPKAGETIPAPTEKATAEAECPDGMEELTGWGCTNLKMGRCSGKGRLRGSAVLKMRLVTPEATPNASSPCRAALLGFPGTVAMNPAMPNHSFPLVAAAESRRKKSSCSPCGWRETALSRN
jgi:hypothetical protein